jgi:hypothetical protein
MHRIRLLLVLGMLGSAVPALADSGPVQISLVTPIQIVPDTKGVSAFRLNLLYGRNTTVQYVDLGLVNHTTADGSKGVQWGLVGMTSGWKGVQLNSINVNQTGFFQGLQWGLVDWADDMEGAQLGWVNVSKKMSGFQLGIINYTETMYGLQIGLANIIRQGGVLPFLPLVNWSF